MVIMACRCPRHVNTAPSVRAFSTSARRGVSLHIKSNLREDVANLVPEYPFGSAQWYKQSNKGLYGGSKIQFGNVSGDKHMVRVRRSWSLNVKRKRLYSEALDRTIQLHVTTRVLRTINRFGGLDEYILGEKVSRIKELGETGWWLRWALMQTDKVKARFAADKQRLEEELAKEMEAVNLASSSKPLSIPQPEQDVVLEEPVSEPDTSIQTQPEASNEASTELAESITGTSRPITSPRLRRMTFRIDRGKQVVFDGRTWRTNFRKVFRAAWHRDVVKVSRLQRRTRQVQPEQSDLENAAQYIEASLNNKKLQRGMPPSILAHRKWLKHNGSRLQNVLQSNAESTAQDSVVTQSDVLRQSMRHRNQSIIASAITRRAKANAYRR